METRSDYRTGDGQNEKTVSPQYKSIWVSPDTHRRVKEAAAKAGMSMVDYVAYMVQLVDEAGEQCF